MRPVQMSAVISTSTGLPARQITAAELRSKRAIQAMDKMSGNLSFLRFLTLKIEFWQ